MAMEHASLLQVERPSQVDRGLEMKRKAFGKSLVDTPRNMLSKDARKFKIGKQILRKASKCERRLSCVFGDDLYRLPDIEDVMGEVVHFVMCSDKSCPYLVSYGFLGNACSCPVRIEIYRKYRR
jgi:hypothetical protein